MLKNKTYKEMANDTLSGKLYEKLFAEQSHFIERIKSLSPDEILKYAQEYVTREDILYLFACPILTNEQIMILLESEDVLSNLADYCGQFETDYMKELREMVDEKIEIYVLDKKGRE